MKERIAIVLLIFLLGCANSGDSSGKTNGDEDAARSRAVTVPDTLDGLPCSAERLNGNDEVLLTCHPNNAESSEAVPGQGSHEPIRFAVWHPDRGIVQRLPELQAGGSLTGWFVDGFTTRHQVTVGTFTEEDADIKEWLVTPEGIEAIDSTAGLLSPEGGYRAGLRYNDRTGDATVALYQEGLLVAAPDLPEGYVPFEVTAVNERGEFAVNAYATLEGEGRPYDYAAFIVTRERASLIPSLGQTAVSAQRATFLNADGELLVENQPLTTDGSLPDLSFNQPLVFRVSPDGSSTQLNAGPDAAFLGINDFNDNQLALGSFQLNGEPRFGVFGPSGAFHPLASLNKLGLTAPFYPVRLNRNNVALINGSSADSGKGKAVLIRVPKVQ